MIRSNEFGIQAYDEYENDDGSYTYLYCDDDGNEAAMTVLDGEIISDNLTGECGCSGCRENK